MTRPATPAISPFFIVSDVARSIAFYRDRSGFAVTFQEPAGEPFFAIIVRDGAQLFLKSLDGVTAMPNNKHHPSLRWDAYVYTPDPDSLAADLASRGTAISSTLQDRNDGLRGFEVIDPDGYVLFFGRPR
ncbi:MAG: hypothetical protein ISS15_16215 [Alphaproteobacteria bacterium]|nr:hypothetical protein [Alphaproteobacteria bacterium]MBL6937970.1 hypothetical protein [Alphaproteobacteria bacterium]MBL7099205.1 hypothetical protein [Alphaproteobacteria bacterium]